MPKRTDRPLRLEASERCTVIDENGSEAEGILINVSDGGFCIESDARFDVGQRIEIRVPGLGQLFGIVRWHTRRRTGGVLEPYTRGAVGS